jgi:hypothetical protein
MPDDLWKESDISHEMMKQKENKINIYILTIMVLNSTFQFLADFHFLDLSLIDLK